MNRAIAVGAALPEFVIDAVDAGRMKTMSAIMRDPNPIHWDVAEVRRLGMGDRVINQGPVSMAYILNMLVAFAGDPARVRHLKVRCLGNVFAGDSVRVGGTITNISEVGSELQAECAVWLDTNGATRMLEGTATIVLDQA